MKIKLSNIRESLIALKDITTLTDVVKRKKDKKGSISTEKLRRESKFDNLGKVKITR